jgi:hypothetical protein
VSQQEESIDNYKKLSTLVLPETVTHRGTTYAVTSIGAGAFSQCQLLTSATIPEGVTQIGANAFKDCPMLVAVNLPSSLESIGQEAFAGCFNLVDFSLPSQLKEIGDRAFNRCSAITDVIIPKTLTKMGAEPFAYCTNLTSIQWMVVNEPSMDNGSPFASIASQITQFKFGSNVKRIPAQLCRGMAKVKSITLPSTLEAIGDKAFQNCQSLGEI